ncbi:MULTISPECIES: NUDIX domain-containing protein [Ensifer]|nr:MULTISPECIES: NUDIX domain-containing protein [unclassified Ensifer]KQW53979.1 DNA mismatch repair protein MutT [Ensifer sp. Root1252]KQW83338.1 DNA mismatch repair protein MutT [Ensifer sp. Root127]KQY68849.1 DNA mismatch repair protein MutT [Ensifer sp. Root142]KRC69156.1 DNA mismatch repair protein MutT [Ensifer sp. Root231]OMQ44058.1 DNA mismatch repair protein MutT [Ensifer sp. 1H6]UBI74286.1 NUDIX domain-containing protein [Ensifer canadensis]
MRKDRHLKQERPPEMRRWYLRVLMRLVHGYYALSRGMTIGVRAACFDVEGRVFLVRHSYLPGWHLPGGGLDRDETALEGLLRELREEGNLETTAPPTLVQVYYNRRTSRRDHVVFYRCDGVRQTLPKVPDLEIAASGFFALDALPDDTTPATRRRLGELAGSTAFDSYW